jgi:hypothetical protein
MTTGWKPSPSDAIRIPIRATRPCKARPVAATGGATTQRQALPPAATRRGATVATEAVVEVAAGATDSSGTAGVTGGIGDAGAEGAEVAGVAGLAASAPSVATEATVEAPTVIRAVEPEPAALRWTSLRRTRRSS